MATGFPAKTSFANGSVLPASDLNDLAGTLNLLSPLYSERQGLITSSNLSGYAVQDSSWTVTGLWFRSLFGFNSLTIALSRNATINTSMPCGIVKTARIPAMRIPFSWVTLNGGAGGTGVIQPGGQMVMTVPAGTTVSANDPLVFSAQWVN